MTGSIFAALVAVPVGVLLLVWARACRRGTFRRNPVLGYRTPLTLRNEWAWVAAHRAAAPYLLWAGVGTVATGGAGLAFVGAGAPVAVPPLITAAIVWTFALLIIAGAPAGRAARRGEALGEATAERADGG